MGFRGHSRSEENRFDGSSRSVFAHRLSRLLLLLLPCVAIPAVLDLTAGVARADVQKDEEYGYSINVPQGWKKMPIAGEEKFYIAKFLCDREYSDKKEGYTHTPDMKVILFPKGAKKTVEAEKIGDDITFLRISNPYKDYKEYLKSDGQGGHFISKEDTTNVGGVDTTWYEVKYEKLAYAPRRAVAFAYHAPDADYVVQFEVLESYWEKLSPTFLTALKSFKLFPRKAPTAAKETTGETGPTSTPVDVSKLTPEEKAKRRAAKFEKDLQVAVSRLPEGWTVKRSKNYVALSHTDDKYTTRILDQAEAVRTWCDTNFGWVGNGIPIPSIIRICANNAEERAFVDTSNRSGWVTEIVISKDNSAGQQSYEFQWVNRRAMTRWFQDRNSKLASAMPKWLDSGLEEFVMTAVNKGGKLDFRPDDWETEKLRETVKTGKLAKAQTMLLQGWEEFYGNTHSLAQAGAFVRYLLQGPGSKGKTKDLLKNYIKNLANAVEEDTKAEAGAENEAKTEEEEQERFKARQQRYKDEEKAFLQRIYDKTFTGWDEKDWRAFEAAYALSVG